MSKLFEIQPTERKVSFRFVTYKNNRIATKILKLLKEGGIYKVSKLENEKENLIFTITIETKKELGYSYSDFKNEILSYIPDNFEANYQFSLVAGTLGFVNSFTVYGMDGILFEFSHRIKEIKSKDRSFMPKREDQIILKY
jgi:hypothetical protein